MIPSPHNLPAIQEEDLLSLVGTVREGKRIDYKECLYTKDQIATELPKDICAFANTEGGCLIIGMEEEGGFATRLVGISPTNTDALFRQYQQIVSSNARPRPSVTFHSVSLKNGRIAVLVSTPASPNRPHAVTSKWPGVFYKRTDGALNEPMDVDEIRSAMRHSETIEERALTAHARQFGSLRGQGRRNCLSIMPFPLEEERIDISLQTVVSRFSSFDGVSLTGSHSVRRSFQGLIKSDGAQKYAHHLLTRSGSLYCWWRSVHPDEGKIRPKSLFCDVGSALDSTLWLFGQLDLTPPAACVLNLLGCKNFTLIGPDEYFAHPIELDALDFPPLLIERFNTCAYELIRPWADRLWQAGNMERCPYYSPEGAFLRDKCASETHRSLCRQCGAK